MGPPRKWRRICLLSMSHWFSLTLGPTYLSCVVAVNSMIFAALTTGKIAQVSFLATTPGRTSFLLDHDDVPLSALKACPLHTDLTF